MLMLTALTIFKYNRRACAPLYLRSVLAPEGTKALFSCVTYVSLLAHVTNSQCEVAGRPTVTGLPTLDQSTLYELTIDSIL